MTKFSDNDSPSLLFTEQGSTPTTPAASHQRLFIRTSDHVLCYVNSSGTVTPVGSAASGSITSSGYTQTTARLLGRTTASTGAIEEITVGSGLSLSAGSLTATGGSGGALVFLEAHTATSSATLDFTTFISSTYDTYRFEFVDILPASNAVMLVMRMGTGGGPTYDTGNNYADGMVRYNSAGSAGSGGTGQSSIELTNSTDTMSNDATYNGCSGFLELFAPQSATYKKLVSQLSYKATNWEGVTATGIYLSTTAVTAVRFFFNSGNVASGTIRCYGVSKT